MKSILWAMAATVVLTGAARAEVVDRTDTGFRIVHSADLAASPAQVYAALGEVGAWWDAAHTYSGKAANLSLQMAPGGCFCERIEGGGVRHAVVLLALPDAMLRLEGGLGPLQGEGVSAVLTFEIKPVGAGAHLVATYHVGGYHPAGVERWAGAVDEVLGVQAARLVRYVETAQR